MNELANWNSREPNGEALTDQRALGGMAEIFPNRFLLKARDAFFLSFLFLSFYFSLSLIARQEDEIKMYIAGPVRRTCPPVPPAAPWYLLHLLHSLPRSPLSPWQPLPSWGGGWVGAGNPARIEERGEENRVRVNKTRERERRGDRGRQRQWRGSRVVEVRGERNGNGRSGGELGYGCERGERAGSARKTKRDKAIAHSQGLALAT